MAAAPIATNQYPGLRVTREESAPKCGEVTERPIAVTFRGETGHLKSYEHVLRNRTTRKPISGCAKFAGGGSTRQAVILGFDTKRSGQEQALGYRAHRRRRGRHDLPQHGVQRFVALFEGDDTLGNARGIADERRIVAVHQRDIPVSSAESVAPPRGLGRDRADFVDEGQAVEQLPPGRMQQATESAGRQRFFDGPKRGRDSQRIADAGDLDEKHARTRCKRFSRDHAVAAP